MTMDVVYYFRNYTTAETYFKGTLSSWGSTCEAGFEINISAFSHLLLDNEKYRAEIIRLFSDLNQFKHYHDEAIRKNDAWAVHFFMKEWLAHANKMFDKWGIQIYIEENDNLSHILKRIENGAK